MATDISIAFRASDNLTQSIRNMQKGVRDISRDISEYRKIQDDAFAKRTEIKLDAEKAKRELKEFAKAVKADKDGATEAFKAKQKEIDQLAEEYRKLSNVAMDCSKAERQLQQDISRTRNAHPERSIAASLTQSADIVTALGKAGLGKMLGDSLGNAAGVYTTSLLGQDLGSAITGVVSSAITGAMMGSIIPGLGPIGAAVGGLVGGTAGIIKEATSYKSKSDDYFRNEAQNLYGNAKAEIAAELSRGTEYYKNKELNQKGLAVLLGSDEKSDKMYEDIRTFGINTPYQSASILNSAKQMLAYGIGEDNIMSTTKMLGDVAMGDQQKLDSLSYAYSQIQSAGVLRGQDLLQLTSAGFNPLQVLADEQGKTLKDMQEAMSKGLVSAQDVARAFSIATAEGGKFYNSAAKMMETYAGKNSMLADIKADIEGAYGEGFANQRKPGIEKEIEDLKGPIGDKMREAYGLIGYYEADLENKHQKNIIDAIEKAQDTEEYQKALAQDNGAEMGRIIAEAKAKAEMEYQNQRVASMADSEKKLVKSIQDDLRNNGTYVEFGQRMANEFSKGWNDPARIIGSVDYWQQRAQNQKVTAPSHATGLGRVPYNGYLAALHEGEQVLTRVEAEKREKQGVGVHIDKLADQIVVREEADIDKIARSLYNKIRLAGENYGGVH